MLCKVRSTYRQTRNLLFTSRYNKKMIIMEKSRIPNIFPLYCIVHSSLLSVVVVSGSTLALSKIISNDLKDSMNLSSSLLVKGKKSNEKTINLILDEKKTKNRRRR